MVQYVSIVLECILGLRQLLMLDVKLVQVASYRVFAEECPVERCAKVAQSMIYILISGSGSGDAMGVSIRVDKPRGPG